ncbi:unnamed protein product [Gadus morhua 'NCC']
MLKYCHYLIFNIIHFICARHVPLIHSILAAKILWTRGSCTYVTSFSVSDSSAAGDISNMANNKRQGQLDLRDYFGFKRTKSTTEEQDNHGEEAGRRAEEPRAGEGTEKRREEEEEAEAEEPRAGEGTDRNMTLPKAVATLSRQGAVQSIPRVGSNNASREAVAVRETFNRYFSSLPGRVTWQDGI